MRHRGRRWEAFWAFDQSSKKRKQLIPIQNQTEQLWSLLKQLKRALGKLFFKSVFPSHFLSWHLCPTGILPSEADTQIVSTKETMFSFLIESQRKCLKLPTLLSKLIVTFLYTDEGCVISGLWAEKSDVWIGCSLHRT